MLRIAGIELHPAARALLGAGLIAIGLVRDAGPAPLLIGGALILWGLAASAQQLRRE